MRSHQLAEHTGRIVADVVAKAELANLPLQVPLT
jgi:hypothetical protein